MLRCGRNFGRRLVCLTDNLPLALGVTKGRAKSSQLTKPLQKICALSLATQTKVHVRWLPSERNVADVPSRATDFWKAQGFEGWWERSNRDHAPQSLQSKAPEKGGSPCDSSPAKKGQGHVRGPNSHGDDIPRGEKRPRANQTGLSEKVQPVHGLVRKFDDHFNDPTQVDNILVEYLQDLFDSGVKLDSGIRIHAAIRFFHPHLGKSASGSLPRCLRALRGWKNADPPLQRMPLPIEGLGAILGFCIATNRREMAIHLFIQWLTYMRPGETSNLLVGQVIPPMSSFLGSLQFFAVLLHPSEAKVPGKTGIFDQGILIDSDMWINPILRNLIQNRPRNAPLWSHNHNQILEVFNQAVVYLKLESLGVSMYTLRHGGASFDIMSRRRSMEEVKQRGRWATDSSLRRYVKTARLQSELHKMHPAVIQFGKMVMLELPNLLTQFPKILKLPFGMTK